MSYPVEVLQAARGLLADVKEYSEQAGFASCDVLPIENDFWRFYLLRP